MTSRQHQGHLMKNILVLLGLLASTSFTLVQANSVQAHPSQRLSSQLTEEDFTTVNYSATNEDAETEDVKTGSSEQKKK